MRKQCAYFNSHALIIVKDNLQNNIFSTPWRISVLSFQQILRKLYKERTEALSYTNNTRLYSLLLQYSDIHIDAFYTQYMVTSCAIVKRRQEKKTRNIWVIPLEIYNSKIFSHETFFKMFFKQFKSIPIFLFRCYMKNVIVMNFFRFAA